MPNYNEASHIGLQLKAICEQSYRPHEVIVIDDASSDDSVKVIEEAISQYAFIKLIKNERNHGIIYSINRAVRMVSGDYLYIPSSNDLVLPGLFEHSLSILASHPQAAFCCSDGLIENLEAGSTWPLKTGWLTRAGYIDPERLTQITRTGKVAFMPLPHSCIMRTKVLPKDELWKPELRCYCDWFLYQVLLFRHGCCFIPEPLVKQRWSADSYCENIKGDPAQFRQVFVETIKLLSTREFADIAPLIIRSRVLLSFKPTVTTPLTLLAALRQNGRMLPSHRMIMEHLLAEFSLFSIFYMPNLLARLARSFNSNVIVPHIYWLINLYQRAFAHAFHQFARLRSIIRKNPKGTNK